LVYLPLAFFSGLWIPIQMFPAILQDAALALPPYHLAQLGLTVIGKAQDTRTGLHLAVLLAVTIVSLGLAARAWRRESGST